MALLACSASRLVVGRILIHCWSIYPNCKSTAIHHNRPVTTALLRFCGEAGGVWTIEAGYSGFQTDPLATPI
jgi:hypothetical protein